MIKPFQISLRLSFFCSQKPFLLHFSPIMLACSVSQSCSTLCNPVDCSPPGSSVHGVLQSRVLEFVIISSSRDPPNPEIKSKSPGIRTWAGRLFTPDPPGRPSFFFLRAKKLWHFEPISIYIAHVNIPLLIKFCLNAHKFIIL